MKKLRLFIAIICIGLLANMPQVLGQDKTPSTSENINKHALGAGAGFTTGYGLSYRYTPNKWGAQVNFAPYKDNETERYSVGLTILYKLIENTNTSLYAYQGNHYYYNSQMEYTYNPIAPFNQTYERVSEGYMNNGVGFGIEIIIAKRISFNLMAGFATYRNFSNINLTGETALYYKF